MRAIDTSVLVRLLVRDDEAQWAAARTLVARGPVFVGVTVMLETEWVLRSAYGFTPAEISGALRSLIGLPSVTAEDAAAVAAALDGLDAGLDFADALHLARSTDCADFVTFDRRLARKATAVTLLES
ncbi:type II toxin-antitoxin system VapC family toxin [Bradyrhizobium sp.]|uniref:type II toxin-antitoxin system VapC family toxin n=1 Tax=Bradyrhizobium sp. TaxID=376 RepID=UPI0025BC9DA3|nr:type II toxin-antitoxin system VapC family toxin [Bradyrhizobium sp.]MCA3254681.1 type II toxin-antitoxin system VapC family toxin [Alphaproteobacteria bacterium]MCA3567468.1 type II toxin-antitoxin system VapC family toxin [Bradyrhizobium sp.]